MNSDCIGFWNKFETIKLPYVKISISLPCGKDMGKATDEVNLIKLVGEEGLEPSRPFGPQDFKSCASANSAIRPACKNKQVNIITWGEVVWMLPDDPCLFVIDKKDLLDMFLYISRNYSCFMGYYIHTFAYLCSKPGIV